MSCVRVGSVLIRIPLELRVWRLDEGGGALHVAQGAHPGGVPRGGGVVCRERRNTHEFQTEAGFQITFRVKQLVHVTEAESLRFTWSHGIDYNLRINSFKMH